MRLLLARPDIRVNMRGMDGHTALIRACFERCVLGWRHGDYSETYLLQG